MFTDQPIFDFVLRGLLLGPLVLLWVTALVRFIGLRSFSKMTAFDFVATVATGSLLANAASATEWSAFYQPVIAIGSILGIQWLLALLRRRSAAAKFLLENEPLLLMLDGQFLPVALERSRITQADIVAKLREANVIDFKSIRAVVLETTGDLSVLHGESLDRSLLDGVRRLSE